jgi:hypothetical protein
VDLRQNDRRPKRRSIRLPGYDYSKPGAYFVSICTKDRKCLFGDIVNREMSLNAAGRMVEKWFGELENKFQDIRCDEYIIMPNHFHAIIQNIGVDPVGADLCVCPDDLCVCPDDLRVCPRVSRMITGLSLRQRNQNLENPHYLLLHSYGKPVIPGMYMLRT